MFLKPVKNTRMTEKQIAEREQKIIKEATELSEKLTKQEVATKIWNKYGRATEVKNGKVIIWSGKKVLAEI